MQNKSITIQSKSVCFKSTQWFEIFCSLQNRKFVQYLLSKTMCLALDIILFAWNQGAWGNAPQISKAKMTTTTTTTELNKQKNKMIAPWICYPLWSHLRNVQRPQMPEPISRFIALLLHTIVSFLRRCCCILFFALRFSSLFPLLVVLFFLFRYLSNSLSLPDPLAPLFTHTSAASRLFLYIFIASESSYHFILLGYCCCLFILFCVCGMFSQL